MTYKWIGAILIVAGCGGFGFSLAATCRQEKKLLMQLLRILHFMENELQFHLLALPELCRKCSKETGDKLGALFSYLATELDRNAAPDVNGCMMIALQKCDFLPGTVFPLLAQLGKILGRFDLPGQINELKILQTECEEKLQSLRVGLDMRLRGYQTLALCAGTALAILFA